MFGLGFKIEPHRLFAGLHVVEQLYDARIRARSYDAVDLGNERLQLLAVPLREASRNDELLPFLFALRMLEDNFGRLCFGRVDERTGVDDDGFGFGRVAHELVACGAEFRDHYLGVDKIFCAAEADERNAGHV